MKTAVLDLWLPKDILEDNELSFFTAEGLNKFSSCHNFPNFHLARKVMK